MIALIVLRWITTRTCAGCTTWGEINPCPKNNICSGGKCVPPCDNQCLVGSKQCAKGGVQTCKVNTSGCTYWDAAVSCPQGDECSGGACITPCKNQCVANAKQCVKGGVQICEVNDASGCTAWNKIIPCIKDEICSRGECFKKLENLCSPRTKQCTQWGYRSCEKTILGYTVWSDYTECPVGQFCSGGDCVASCSDQCQPEQKRCYGPKIQTCRLMPTGCTDWDWPLSCPAGSTCFDKQCVAQCPPQCEEGALRCLDHGSQTCKRLADNCIAWDFPKPCPEDTICHNLVCECQQHSMAASINIDHPTSSYYGELSMAQDSAGNAYILGKFSAKAQWGAITLQAQSDDKDDIFVAKIFPTGKVIWATSAGGAEYDSAHSIAVDHHKNVCGVYHMG